MFALESPHEYTQYTIFNIGMTPIAADIIGIIKDFFFFFKLIMECLCAY